MLKQLKYTWIVIAALSMGLTACSDILDIEPSEVLLKDQVYNNRYDAEVAVRGIYGQFVELSEQIIVLNELRADLMDVTVNSNQDLRDLNDHNVSEGNVYIDPLPMYRVINNCNDVLSNFLQMKDEKKLLDADFNRVYSEVGAIRSYVYLQLAIHYGNIPFVTEPVVDYKDLADQSLFPRLSLQEVVVKLIEFMETLPDLGQYVDESMDFPSVIYVNKLFLLGDLYLWNDQYLAAASMYKSLMESFGDNSYDRYRIIWADVLQHNDLNVGYVRYREDDVLSLITDRTKGWRSIFTRNFDVLFQNEWIWVVPFENTFEVENPFINLFANQGAGSYLVQPSEQANYYWNQQIQRNQIPWDARRELSWREIDGERVITKFIENYDPLDAFNKAGFWYINRAALLHLRFAEAANRDGQSRVAHALLNHGISTEYGSPGATDITYLQRTLLPFPYDFDARMNQTGQIPVGVRDPWHRNTGIRGRANLNSHVLGEISQADSVAVLEDQIIEEVALELAFEGHRWGDLVRIALRNSDPSFLADKVADKLAKSGSGNAEEVRAKLMDPAKWFLPFPEK